MPLVIFNFYNDELTFDGEWSSKTLSLPREAMDAKWTLRGVNGIFFDNAHQDFTYLELEIPELMTTETVLYGKKQIGNIEEPPSAFRFYVKHSQLSEKGGAIVDLWRERSVFSSVSEYPNWSFGKFKLETPEISVRLRCRLGNLKLFTNSPMNGASIILSYEQ